MGDISNQDNTSICYSSSSSNKQSQFVRKYMQVKEELIEEFTESSFEKMHETLLQIELNDSLDIN
jgi:hypothetical protein